MENLRETLGFLDAVAQLRDGAFTELANKVNKRSHFDPRIRSATRPTFVLSGSPFKVQQDAGSDVFTRSLSIGVGLALTDEREVEWITWLCWSADIIECGAEVWLIDNEILPSRRIKDLGKMKVNGLDEAYRSLSSYAEKLADSLDEVLELIT